MSKIIPFPALLPRPDLADKILCPPYDVVSREEARQYAAGNQYSLLHVTKAEIDIPDEVGEYDDCVYKRARTNFLWFQDERCLVPDDESFYIYRLEMRGHTQTGLVCGVSVDEYDDDLIKKHEKTRKEKEDDRTKFALIINAHAEPVFLVFRDQQGIKELLNKETNKAPLYHLTDKGGVRHIFWKAESKQEIAQAFLEIPALYVADGHHRSAVASRVRALKRDENPNHLGDEPYNFFPAVIFPHDEVKVYKYDWDGDPLKRPLADVTADDIMKLADEGGIMPPKSTWFQPKLGSGLFVYRF